MVPIVTYVSATTREIIESPAAAVSTAELTQFYVRFIYFGKGSISISYQATVEGAGEKLTLSTGATTVEVKKEKKSMKLYVNGEKKSKREYEEFVQLSTDWQFLKSNVVLLRDEAGLDLQEAMFWEGVFDLAGVNALNTAQFFWAAMIVT